MRKSNFSLATVKQNTFEYYLSHSKDSPRKDIGVANIVFLNGYRTAFSSWRKVYTALEHQANILLYNRLGIGASSKVYQDQFGDEVLQNLLDLMSMLAFNPPYIIVAHSLGGIFANLFARRYPERVSALVMVDCPHVDEIPYMKALKLPNSLKLFNTILQLMDKWLDRFKHSEDEQIYRTLSLIEKAGPFPEIPLRVISGEKKMPLVPEHFFAVHMRFQQQLLELSRDSKQILCPNSAHFPQITEPGLIVEAICELLPKT